MPICYLAVISIVIKEIRSHKKYGDRVNATILKLSSMSVIDASGGRILTTKLLSVYYLIVIIVRNLIQLQLDDYNFKNTKMTLNCP